MNPHNLVDVVERLTKEIPIRDLDLKFRLLKYYQIVALRNGVIEYRRILSDKSMSSLSSNLSRINEVYIRRFELSRRIVGANKVRIILHRERP